MTTTAETPSHTLGCYLAVNDARSALNFYEPAFGARRRGEPILRISTPDTVDATVRDAVVVDPPGSAG